MKEKDKQSKPGHLMDGKLIEQESYAIIERHMQAASAHFRPDEHAIVRRVVHATADISFIDTIRFSPGAIDRGIEAINRGAPVICDVNMLVAGCTHSAGEVICAIKDPAVAEMARTAAITRAAAAMRFLGDRLDGAIVAIGNAPTALWTLMELAQNGGPVPALIVGMPVGFVGAEESKTALSKTQLTFITNLSPRGGSPAAAAAVNALAQLSSVQVKAKGCVSTGS